MGRKRNLRRRRSAAKKAEAAKPTGVEGTDRAPSGLTKIHDARLESLAVRQGWIKPQKRWKTNTPKRKLLEKKQQRPDDLTLGEAATLAAFELMDGDDRAKGIGARIAVSMVGQNIDLDKMALGQEPQQHEHRHLHVVIEEDEGWYGNDGHAKAAQALAASAARDLESGPVQSSDLRSAVGEDGSGSANGDSGARPDAGSPQGSP